MSKEIYPENQINLGNIPAQPGFLTSPPIRWGQIPFPPPRRTRVSADTPNLQNYRVTLDGEELPFCIFADEQFGIAVCADVTREEKCIRFKKDADYKWVSIVHRGNVRIEEVG